MSGKRKKKESWSRFVNDTIILSHHWNVKYLFVGVPLEIISFYQTLGARRQARAVDKVGEYQKRKDNSDPCEVNQSASPGVLVCNAQRDRLAVDSRVGACVGVTPSSVDTYSQKHACSRRLHSKLPLDVSMRVSCVLYVCAWYVMEWRHIQGVFTV